LAVFRTKFKPSSVMRKQVVAPEIPRCCLDLTNNEIAAEGM
jgi:hypothetical protein